MKELVVEEKYNNKKINTFLFEKFPNLKQSTLYKALRKKDIRVNDKRICENVTLTCGDNIKVFISDEFLYNISNFNLDIIYEDDNIIIVNKPIQIEVISDTEEISLSYYLEQYLLEKQDNIFIKPCHRLDRNTSGLVLFAKNEESLNILLDKFKNKEIEKHYKATVYGILKEKEKRLEAYLFKDNKKSLVYISDTPKQGYLKIITTYHVISENKSNNTSILDINLETGRTHQIRAHLAHIGYPIIGDGKYGINSVNKQFNKKYQELCSYSIKFNFLNNSGILDYLNGKEFKI